jgi:hypothetical protein
MRALVRYIGWEIVALHAITGALYVLVNAILLAALLPDRWWLALALTPLTIFGAWGWYAESAYVLRASRDLRMQ